MSKKINKGTKIALWVIVLLAAVFSAILGVAYSRQDEMVQQVVGRLNQDFEGRLEIKGSHISPFTNFPYISIDLENLRVFESKADTSDLLMSVKDTYVGFDMISLIGGSVEIKKLTLSDGFIKLVQHADGTFNIANALSEEQETTSSAEETATSLDLQSIELNNIDLLKLNEESNMLIEAFIEEAESSFKTSEKGTDIWLDSKFLFNLILDNDTSFLHDKHVELHTGLRLENETNVLSIDPSEVLIEKALFMMQGSVDFDADMDLDLKFSGEKPNFDLFLAFAPAELSPVLAKYENAGKIYFNAAIDGPSINGHNPAVNIDFGCAEAFIQNVESEKTVNDLFFEGRFTNGTERDASTMELVIKDFSAKPETGVFKGNVLVRNFDSPEFDIQLISDFDLDFLVKFFDLKNLEHVSGKVSLEMNFHDIIDLSQPEKSIERLNESYFTKLNVSNLSAQSSLYHLPVSNVNIRAEMDGHEARIDQFDFKVGESDLKISAMISDLPAILHHTNIPVEAVLDINSTLIDLAELTRNDTTDGINEQVKDLSLRLKFNSTARAFTESPNLPLGEFFIEELYAQFTNYPHQLHDFNADVFVDSADFRIVDFTGMIDKSDFHFNGKLQNYDLWFEEEPQGDTKVDFYLRSDLIKLEDLFSYGGENYVPEDYRHEEFSDLLLHGIADMRFDRKLTKTTLNIDRLEASMKIHPMRFENFSGQFYLDSTMFQVVGFGGELGNSDFRTDLSYFFSADSLDKVHSFSLVSDRLDFDQLFAYNPPPAGKTLTPEDHEAGFNIFTVPFADLNFQLKINHLNYHRYLLDNFLLKGKMQSDHYIYIDTLRLAAAGGQIGLSGYFNGSDPKEIYFSPDMKVDQIDLDKLLFKFENFGQDHLVSENLHGLLSGTVQGKVHMHADMVPIIDDSQLDMDISVYNGSINNYAVFEALSDYFADKNLSNVRFDTLKNTFQLKDGVMKIPNMSISSTLGYFEVSGKQSMDMNMEYYMRIPIKIVTKAGVNKLFSRKNEVEEDQVDMIVNKEDYEGAKFLNLKIEGTPENYTISMGKDK